MRNIFQVVVLTLLTASLTIFALAQKQKSQGDYFKEIGTLSNTKKPEDLAKAYQLAKEFVTVYPKEKGDNINKLKDFIKRYRENQFYIELDAKKYAEAFSLGKEILAEKPDDTAVMLNLAYGGYIALSTNKDKTYVDDSANYASQTLQLLEKGSFPASFAPFANKEDAIAWLHYIHGSLIQAKDLKAAVASYYKATLYESQIKKSSQPYLVFATYYETVYEKMTQEKAEADKINKIVDRMLDAYARAYTLGVAEKNPQAESWKQRLAQVYKFSKGTDAGFEAYIKYVVSTPLVDPSQF